MAPVPLPLLVLSGMALVAPLVPLPEPVAPLELPIPAPAELEPDAPEEEPVEPIEPVEGLVVEEEPVEPVVSSVFLLQPARASAAVSAIAMAVPALSVGACISVFPFLKIGAAGCQPEINLAGHRLFSA